MKLPSRFKPFIPTGYPLAAMLVAIGIVIVGTIVSVLYGLSEPGPFIGRVFSFLGLIFFSLAALIVEFGAWIERRAAPKLTLGCGAALTLATACGMTSIAMVLLPGDNEPSEVVSGMICLSLPVVFVFAVPAIIALIRVGPELKATVQQEHEQRVIEMIQAKGMITYPEVSSELGIRDDEIDRLLIKLVQEEKLVGFRVAEHKQFYTVPSYWEKQSQLLGMIAARGEVRLEEVALELGVPINLLKEWIYAAVQTGKFTGYINWDKGVLYSADAETLRKGERCPHCGGMLGLAGKGIIECHHCHVEVFL